jgi:DNA-binding XRE family transcriptional regulator
MAILMVALDTDIRYRCPRRKTGRSRRRRFDPRTDTRRCKAAYSHPDIDPIRVLSGNYVQMPATDDSRPSTGPDLRKLRLAHGLTQAEVGRAMGIAQPRVSTLEGRYFPEPRLAQRYRSAVNRLVAKRTAKVSSTEMAAPRLPSGTAEEAGRAPTVLPTRE